VLAEIDCRAPFLTKEFAWLRSYGQDYAMVRGGGDDSPGKRHPWREIAGYVAEDADSLLALLVALVFALLGPLGFVSQAAINASILGTLAVIAIIMLRDRGNAKSLSQKTMDEFHRVVAETREEVRRIAADSATVQILRGTEVQEAHAKARASTDHWYFKGGTGTYLRAVTLKKCLQDRRRPMEFRIEIIDPRDVGACRRYDNFRLTRSPGTNRAGDSWQAGQARLESYATVFAACWYNQHSDFVTIRVGLTRTASTFRYDMSSDRLIITRDDPELPAELIPQQAPLFSAYDRELKTSFDQAEHVDVERVRQKVSLSEHPGPGEVKTLLEALGLIPPEQPLAGGEATVILQKALEAPNPYPTEHEP
jgi:hypothetical protein